MTTAEHLTQLANNTSFSVTRSMVIIENSPSTANYYSVAFLKPAAFKWWNSPCPDGFGEGLVPNYVSQKQTTSTPESDGDSETRVIIAGDLEPHVKPCRVLRGDSTRQ